MHDRNNKPQFGLLQEADSDDGDHENRTGGMSQPEQPLRFKAGQFIVSPQVDDRFGAGRISCCQPTDQAQPPIPGSWNSVRMNGSSSTPMPCTQP